MQWVDYDDGQDITGYDYIGIEECKFPIMPDMDVVATVEELRRRCGRAAPIKLFKEDEFCESR